MKVGGLQIAAICVSLVAIGIIIASNLYFGSRIALSRIPMQWGLDGSPTWYARSLGLWFSLFDGLYWHRPRGHWPFAENGSGVWYSLILFSAIMAVVQWWHLNAVVRWALKQ